MRKSTMLTTLAGLALLFATGTAHAGNEFEALLADVNFGGAEKAIEATTSQSASDAVTLASAESIQDPLAMPVPPTPQPMAPEGFPVVQTNQFVTAADGCSGGNCGDCGHDCHGHGCHNCLEGFCNTYTPPRLPHSCFYQYWRTDSCNVNVWDGWRNHCRPNIDLTIKHGHCGNGGCGSGCSDCGGCADCGPAPSEWCNKGCDTGCDSCE